MPDNDDFGPYTDWTGSLTAPKSGEILALAERVNRIDQWVKAHAGIDAWSAGPGYPHPSQMVNTLIFYEGNGQLSNQGFQIIGSTSLNPNRGLYWVQKFFNEGILPPSFESYASIIGSTSRPMESPLTSELKLTAYYGENSTLRLGGNSNHGGGASIEVGSTYYSLFMGQSQINTPLFIVGLTTDPTVRYTSPQSSDILDGGIWYRTDLQEFRVGINSVVYTLATTDDIPDLSIYQKRNYRAVSTTATAGVNDVIIGANAASAAFTVNLVTAAGNSGLVLTIKKTDSTNNIVTIDPSGSQTIDGVTTVGLSQQYQYITIVSDGSNWLVTGKG